MNIQEIRAQYPQYEDLSDKQIADALHTKHYKDMPKGDFYSKIGLSESIDVSGVDFSAPPQQPAIDPNANVPGLLTSEQRRELDRRVTIAPDALTQNFTQGIRETGQGLGQVGVSLFDHFSDAPIKRELGIDTPKLPEYNRNVLDQRQQFEREFGGVPGSGLAKGAGQAAPYFLLPPVTNAPGMAAMGMGIAGSQFAETPEERQSNMKVGGLIGGGVPIAGKAITGILSQTGKGVNLLAEGINRLRGKTTPGMMDKLGGLDDQAVQRLQQSKSLGLDYITPAEATGNPLLAARQGAVGKTTTGKEVLIPKQSARINSEKAAIRTLLDDITPDGLPANREARDAATKILGEKRSALTKMSKPLYDKAYADAVPDEFVSKQMQDPLVAKAAGDVLSDPALKSDYLKWASETGYKGAQQNTVKFWDLVRRKLSDMATPNKISKSTNEQRIAGDAARTLNSSLDDISNNYKTARNFYSDEAPRALSLEKSKIAQIAKMDDVQVKNVSRTIFDPNETDIRVMRSIRQEFQKEDPSLWVRMVRGEIERRLDATKTEAIGSTFYKSIIASERDYRLFSEALTGNPIAQQKLKAAKNVFGNLLNPQGVKSLEFMGKTNISQNRNMVDSIQSMVMDFAGGRMDRAAVEFITNPAWNKEYQTVARIKSATARNKAAIELIRKIAENLASRPAIVGATRTEQPPQQ